MDRQHGESYDEELLGLRYRPPGGAPISLASTTRDAGGTRPDADSPKRPVRRSLLDVAVAVLVMGLVAALVLRPWQSTGRTPGARLALATYQSHPGGAYLSGQVVALAWSRMPQVAVYRFEIARAPGIVLPAIALARPWHTILTDRTAVHLRVLGPQIYYWRVQPYLGHAWGAWSPARIFGVGRPAIDAPTPQQPKVKRAAQAARVTLCWSRVPIAAGYRLQVDGTTVVVTGTCHALSLAAGTHQWRVRALARGLGLFAGPATPLARLVVRAATHPRSHTRARIHHVSSPVAPFPAIVPALSAPSPPVLVVDASVRTRSRKANRHHAAGVLHHKHSRRHPRVTHRAAAKGHQATPVRPGLVQAAIPPGPVERVRSLPIPRPPSRKLVTTAAGATPTSPAPAPTATVGPPPPPPPPPGS